MRVVFHPQAYEEMLESARFYEQKSTDLGIQFLSAVFEAISIVERFPQLGSIETGEISIYRYVRDT
jgi:hypothetical protein